MKAIDTNVLVHAVIRRGRQHEAASSLLTGLAEGHAPWALPWPCVYEFLRVVTHPRVFHPPIPLERALDDLGRILASPSLTLLSESPRHVEVMARLLRDSSVTGNLVHDAHIAALCLEHGVTELITGDRDFGRFPELRVTNPFGGH